MIQVSLSALLNVLEVFEGAYLDMYAHPQNYPHKHAFYVRDYEEFVNVLTGRFGDMVGTKMVYVNEREQKISAKLTYTDLSKKNEFTTLEFGNYTLLRSAISAAYAVQRGGCIGGKVGFIGGGRINILTASILANLGTTQFALIGGRKDSEKNREVFEEITGCNFVTQFDDCDVVVSCTTNDSREDLYSVIQAPRAILTIAQDGGFTLDETWRHKKFALLSDYPAQMNSHLADEFIFDKEMHLMGYDLTHLNKFYCAGVYLYGTIAADMALVRVLNSDNVAFNQYARKILAYLPR